MAVTLTNDGMTISLVWADGAKTPAGDTSQLTQADLDLVLHNARTIEGLVLERCRSVIAKSRKTILAQRRADFMADPNVNTDDEVIAAVLAEDGYQNAEARAIAVEAQFGN
tara:strand:+ start:538 stop:870 length:333 start_codon:yes stop_codon:yes gene_type:complete